VRGAFTGAVAPKKGLFEVADQGTLFLDEISTIGPETQAKLLRVIQEREFMRLGGTETIKTDVRILAASNADLATMVREGRFREDLYHRLNVIRIELPSLRERKEDVPLLVAHFLARYCQENQKTDRLFTPAAMRLLMDYDWPGNIRELENVVERAVVLSSEESLGPELLPENIRTREILPGVRLPAPSLLGGAASSAAAAVARTGAASAPGLEDILEEVQRRLILDMLERTAWNQTEAAERFQIPLSTLNQKIKRLGIDVRRRGRSSATSEADSSVTPGERVSTRE
jgi:DNA-binding NtrC family response regulator